MANNIKELVKKHFNLVEPAPEQTFAMIKSADGELELTYEGEALAEGLDIFVVTADGNVPAPDGSHDLEGGVTIVTVDGKISEIMETPVEAEEEVLEEDAEEALEDHEEEMEEDIAEDLEEHVEPEGEAAMDEEVIVAVVEAVKDAVEEMTKDMEERLKDMEDKMSKFSSAPASDKTIATSLSKSKKAESKHSSLMKDLIAKKKRN
jgi:rubrerythrin